MTERQEPSERDDFASRIAAPLRERERLDASFEGRVMSAVRTEARERTRASEARRAEERGWWRRPRTVRVSPLAGLAMAAGISGIVVLASIAGRSPAGSATRTVATNAPVAAAAETVHVVRFVLLDREASAVSLVADFNAWAKDVTPLVEAGEDGLWTVSVEVPRGRHEYAFVVRRENGEAWVADPLATKVRDDFGTESSIITVAAPRANAAPPAAS